MLILLSSSACDVPLSLVANQRLSVCREMSADCQSQLSAFGANKKQQVTGSIPNGNIEKAELSQVVLQMHNGNWAIELLAGIYIRSRWRL